MRVYYDRDADVNLIKGKKIAIFGYGSQGHAHANNLRDSGATDVVVSLRPGSASVAKAEGAGLQVMGADKAAAWADVVMVLTPDELQAQLYRGHLEKNLKQGAALAFAHGFNIHFKAGGTEARPRCLHDRAEGSRPHGARRIPARRRRAVLAGGGA